MKSCTNCEFFRKAKLFSNLPECHIRNKIGKAGLNFGSLFLDLAEECPDYLPPYSNEKK